MKVAVASKGGTLSSLIDEHFGRSAFFVIANTESMAFESIENQGPKESDAAGVRASQMLIDRGVDAVVVKNIGHNALVTLRGAGIQVYGGASGVVVDIIDQLRKGKLAAAERPTVGFQDGLEETE